VSPLPAQSTGEIRKTDKVFKNTWTPYCVALTVMTDQNSAVNRRPIATLRISSTKPRLMIEVYIADPMTTLHTAEGRRSIADRLRQETELMSALKASLLLNIHRDTLYEWARKRHNGIPVIRDRARIRFDPEKLAAWVLRCEDK
jgi:hypothetical protein